MRIFLAGASGVVGPALLPALAKVGHQVHAMTRTPEKAAAIAALGAEPVVCDVYDEVALEAAVAAAQPDVVISHLTDLTAMNEGRLKEAYAANDRVRTVGVPNLARAARAAGARRIVAQSIAFAYAPEGEGPASEDEPLFVDAPPPWGATVRAVAAMERAVNNTEGIEAVVLRFGFWYGPGSAYAADGAQAREVRRRRFPIAGGGRGVWSFAHIDDVVATTIAALDCPNPGTYNVCDDDPAPVRVWLPAYAEVLGTKRPLRVPKLAAQLGAGFAGVHLMTTLRGADNTKAKRELGWQPAHPSWREGFRTALG